MRAKLITAVFCTMLGGLALWNLLTPALPFSQTENRYLAQLPAFSAVSLAKGALTKELDGFINDQFVARDRWMALNTRMEKLLGKRSAGGVYFARDGSLVETFDSLDREQYDKNIGYLATFTWRMEEALGITPDILLAPTAGGVRTQLLPAFAPEIDQQALLEESAADLKGLVDVIPALREHREEPIYYRTDHHWTSLGAYYAYADWRRQRGEAGSPLSDFRQQPLSESFYGTNYSKANLYTVRPDTITAFILDSAQPLAVDYNGGELVTDTIYQTAYLSVKDQYPVFLGGNQPLTRIGTGVQNGRRLLLIKDSYANTFVQMVLGDYEEIIVLDLRYFRAPVVEFARDNGVTDALVLYNIKGFSTDLNLFYLIWETPGE